jgi:hypothetical protein
VVKLPLYNKIRSLKRKLAASEAKVRKTTALLRRKKEKHPVPQVNSKKSAKVVTPPLPQLPDLPIERDESIPQVVEAHNVDNTQPIPVQKSKINTTPKKGADKIMEKYSLTPADYPEICKDLTAYRALVQQIAKAPKNIRVSLLEKRDHYKKSRIASHIASDLGVNRKSVMQKHRKNVTRRLAFAREKAAVVHFLKKPENSTCLPGKRDTSAKGQQRYSLNETMSNLYKRYKVKHPNSTISLATFCRQKPPYMKTIQWADRRQCLCVYHQNGILKLKAIKKNISVSRFLQENSADKISEMLNAMPNTTVRFREWQREEISYQDSTIKKLRLNEVEMNKEDFISKFEDDFTKLREHVKRMKNQFQELERLKTNLPRLTHASCQMDYSENHCCTFQDEPAQAFFDRRQVTIHPMVIHYNDTEGTLQHKSFVGISPEKGHTAATTFAFLRKLVPKVKELLPQLTSIQYITDSPVSQYRNKKIVKIIAQHVEYFDGINCTWDYLESGHGKGPCDGVGGSLKRSADTAVKAGEIISNAEEFYNWASANSKTISCIYVTSGDVSVADRMLKNAKPIKGLSICHTVRPYNGHLYIRDMSCYKQCCQEIPTCPGWKKTDLKVSQVQVEQEVTQDNEVETVIYEVGSIVDATYKRKVYRGQIVQYDDENKDYNIKFMKKNHAGQYIWPKTNTWSTWVPGYDIIKVIE